MTLVDRSSRTNFHRDAEDCASGQDSSLPFLRVLACLAAARNRPFLFHLILQFRVVRR